MPKLADFMESLTHEKDKLVIMGTIKPSKDQDLRECSKLVAPPSFQSHIVLTAKQGP